ncbi:MAG: hypothetical protein KDK78_05455, partial [Chlamydiia bacterium]|nr:hypothetical protein [Chlamydiia bacterium]
SEFRKSSRAALDAAVLGQDKAKELVHGVTGRWISTGKASGVCLGFEGSPGVGKTELAMA